MAKNKLARFRDNLNYNFLYQPNFSEVWDGEFTLRGQWHNLQFHNTAPITLELGCGRGEYTIEMAKMQPAANFIGMDIKGARLWVGASTVARESLSNVAFIRGKIETLSAFFAPSEIANLWLTFPDPQLKERRAKKRLTERTFLQLYARILAPSGVIHLKTDSQELYHFTLDEIQAIGGRVLHAYDNIDNILGAFPLLQLSTYYERFFRERGKNICYLAFQLPVSWQKLAQDKRTPRAYWLQEEMVLEPSAEL